jgi:hypothetical protein
MMQLLGGIQENKNFATPFVVPKPPKGKNREWTSDIKEAVAVAMSHPVPLTVDFEKGFTGSLANLEPVQIISLLFTDISALRIALLALEKPKDESEKELIKVMAWRGYLQSLYASWLSFSCGIRLRISESENGYTNLEVTACDIQDAGFEDAYLRIANDGDTFTGILTKCGEVADPIGNMGATINNALQTLAVIEQSCFFSFTHCNESDTKETRDYFLSMAKAAFLVRATAMNWLLKGVKGFKKTKPLSKEMKVNLKALDKKELYELESQILESLWCLSLGLMMFQFVAKAQNLFAPNSDAFSCHINK